jgi:hypothetical protein
MLTLNATGMLVVLLISVMLAALVMAAVLPVALVARATRPRRNPLARVFGSRELRALDEDLNKVAAEELERIAVDVVQYVTGDAGYVVVVSDCPRRSLALWLSDGRLLRVDGVARLTRSLLLHRAANDRLHPAQLDQEGYEYRLLLRGESGTEMHIHTPLISLTQ